jgi:hypothetical protein
MSVSNDLRPPYAKTKCAAYSPDGQADGKPITSPRIRYVWVGFDPQGPGCTGWINS